MDGGNKRDMIVSIWRDWGADFLW